MMNAKTLLSYAPRLFYQGILFCGPILTLLYPLAASFEALDSPGPDDNKQWLTYWVIYSFLTFIETFLSPLISWIPGYGILKLALVAWLVLPYFRGAAFLYHEFFHPYGNRLRAKLNDRFGDHSYLLKGKPEDQDTKGLKKFFALQNPSRGKAEPNSKGMETEKQNYTEPPSKTTSETVQLENASENVKNLGGKEGLEQNETEQRGLDSPKTDPAYQQDSIMNAPKKIVGYFKKTAGIAE